MIESQVYPEQSKSVIIKCINLLFNNINCYVLNFTDMTSFLDLEKQKEKYRMIKLLNTTIHHEMIAPLKAQMDISKCLADTQISFESKQMAQTINVSSQMLLLHTQDLLDQRIIDKGSFSPNYTLESVQKVINEIVDMMNFTLHSSKLKIQYIQKKNPRKFYFDKRRV